MGERQSKLPETRSEDYQERQKNTVSILLNLKARYIISSESAVRLCEK